MLFSTQRISGLDTEFESEGLKQYSKCNGLTSKTANKGDEDTGRQVIGLSFDPSHKK